MDKRGKRIVNVRRVMGVLLVLAGLSTTWAWGQVARLSEPIPPVAEPEVAALYGAWQPDGEDRPSLFRSLDGGETWLPLELPVASAPVAWSGNGRRLAVATADGSLLRSSDRGETWSLADSRLAVVSLCWGDDGSLFLGTDGQGIVRLASDGTPFNLTRAHEELSLARIVGLALTQGRLFAATSSRLFSTDDATGAGYTITWTSTQPLSEQVTALAATDRQTVFVGTATTGVYRSSDAGLTWQPAWSGLGLAAGQAVRVTALAADPTEGGVLYTAIDHVVGSTRLHASAAGLYATVDGAASWQPLAGPAFPEARSALGLVVAPRRPLYAQAITAGGLQSYELDVARTLAALESDDPKLRLRAARQLGLARSPGAASQLLESLDDPDPAVGLAAAAALARIDDPDAAPGLLIALEHPSQSIRLGAARALGHRQVEAAVEPLRAMLLAEDDLEAATAGEALGRIGGPAALDALLAALADPQRSTRWHVALAAVEKIGAPAVEPLAALFHSADSHVRRNAAQALGWTAAPSAVEALAAALRSDGDATVRGQAAWALGQIAETAGVPLSRAASRALDRARSRDSAAEVQAAAEWAQSRAPLPADAASVWPARWSPALTRFRPVRWLILALSLAGASWLMAGIRPLLPTLLRIAAHRPHSIRRIP